MKEDNFPASLRQTKPIIIGTIYFIAYKAKIALETHLPPTGVVE